MQTLFYRSHQSYSHVILPHRAEDLINRGKTASDEGTVVV